MKNKDHNFNVGDTVYTPYKNKKIKAYVPLVIVGFDCVVRTAKIYYYVCEADKLNRQLNDNEICFRFNGNRKIASGCYKEIDKLGQSLIYVNEKRLRPYDERSIKKEKKCDMIYNFLFIVFLAAMITILSFMI